MEDVLKADIFFVITSVVTIIFGLLLCVLMYYIIRIARTIRRIVDRIDEGSEAIAHDIDELRTHLSFASLVAFLSKIVPKMRSKK